MENEIKLSPRCLKDAEGNRRKPVSFSALGYFIPCCWCDTPKVLEEFSTITQEKFHIDNIESPYEVFHSKEWKELMDTIVNDGKNAPDVCRRKCASNWYQKIRIVNDVAKPS